MKGKKGAIGGRNILWVVIYVFAILIFILALRIGIASHIISENKIANSVFSSIYNRVLTSPGCALYFDSQRVYPGVVDISLFNEQNINKCVQIKEAKYSGAILDLRRIDSSVVSIVKINPIVADLYYACNIKEKNFRCLTKRQNVILYDKGSYIDGYLDFFVVVLNE